MKTVTLTDDEYTLLLDAVSVFADESRDLSDKEWAKLAYDLLHKLEAQASPDPK